MSCTTDREILAQISFIDFYQMLEVASGTSGIFRSQKNLHLHFDNSVKELLCIVAGYPSKPVTITWSYASIYQHVPSKLHQKSSYIPAGPVQFPVELP